MVGWWSEALRIGASVDSGIVEMPLGANLTLRVVDTDGAPVAAFGVQLRSPMLRPGSTDGRWYAPNWRGRQFSGADGRTPTLSVMAGRHVVESAHGTGHEHLSPEAVVVPADRTDVLVDVVVASPDLAQCV